jgi:hypothetical protein
MRACSITSNTKASLLSSCFALPRPRTNLGTAYYGTTVSCLLVFACCFWWLVPASLLRWMPLISKIMHGAAFVFK